MTIKMQPKKYEEQKEFNQRCMNNAQLGSSYPNRDDRFTVCQMLWKKNYSLKITSVKKLELNCIGWNRNG